MHTQFMNAWFQLSCLLRESSGLLNQLMNYFDIPTLVLDTHNSTTYKTMNAWFQLSCLLTYSTIKDFNFRASIWIKISLYVDEKKYKSLISVFSSKSVLIYYEHICWAIATKCSSWLLMYCKCQVFTKQLLLWVRYILHTTKIIWYSGSYSEWWTVTVCQNGFE